MSDDEKTSKHVRKLRIQKSILLGIVGMVACGIIVSYIDFHNQVTQYMQSMAYRKAQAASMEYKMKLMKRDQQLSSSDESKSSTTSDYKD